MAISGEEEAPQKSRKKLRTKSSCFCLGHSLIIMALYWPCLREELPLVLCTTRLPFFCIISHVFLFCFGTLFILLFSPHLPAAIITMGNADRLKTKSRRRRSKAVNRDLLTLPAFLINFHSRSTCRYLCREINYLLIKSPRP